MPANRLLLASVLPVPCLTCRWRKWPSWFR
ncbi:hypothetical protein APX70_200477 [Pseudomonas syringae pv. maculicola]|uniref:Uncharacterized protein n=1 Tax=Pseudomonas syringae pv. maculicola TaxID=59511 RepID=A0A3M3A590_PSEYM|nr:hypothetical protein APX70_200477 [Pseudomonas syringae pv. maculicola]